MAGSLLSGLSVLAGDIARILVHASHTANSNAALTRMQTNVALLEELVQMAASTTASAILLHCKELKAALDKADILRNTTFNKSVSDGAASVERGLHVQVRRSDLHVSLAVCEILY